MLLNLPAAFSRGQRHLSTNMEGLIGSSSAHYIEGFHPQANLSPCKQLEFDVRPHFIKCLDQRSSHYISGLAVKAPHLHVMSQRMLPVSGSLSSAEDDWLRCYTTRAPITLSAAFDSHFTSLSTTASSFSIMKVLAKDLCKPEVDAAVARIR